MELLVGLNVLDDGRYRQYREAMRPLLESHGGEFRYDFKVAEVLASATPAPINRVFTIGFPSEQAQVDFFANPDYLEVKKRYFESSVGDTTILASYTLPGRVDPAPEQGA